MGRESRRVFLLLPPLLILHQNYWMWDDASLVAGLPVNLAYHLVLCFLVSVVMFCVVRRG